MRKFAIIVFALSLSLFAGFFHGLAVAQIPTAGNVYFGYTYYNTNLSNTNLSLNRRSLNGFEGTLEGKLAPLLGIVADITGHYGSLDFPVALPLGTCAIGVTCPAFASANAHIYEAMFGPRISALRRI
jgi:hypothetical protein